MSAESRANREAPAVAGASKSGEERESRMFYYVGDGGAFVREVRGWICKDAQGYWWCPEVGVSASENYSLFRDRAQAYDRAAFEARHVLETAKATLARIEAERWS